MIVLVGTAKTASNKMLDLFGSDEVFIAVSINYKNFCFSNSFWRSNCVTMSMKDH